MPCHAIRSKYKRIDSAKVFWKTIISIALFTTQLKKTKPHAILFSFWRSLKGAIIIHWKQDSKYHRDLKVKFSFVLHSVKSTKRDFCGLFLSLLRIASVFHFDVWLQVHNIFISFAFVTASFWMHSFELWWCSKDKITQNN